jgi:IclR family pca regulon transcriptional regulator
VLLAALAPQELAAFLARAPFAPRTPRTLTEADALAVELDRIRNQGWAIVDGELEAGLRSISIPVRGGDGQTIAALNIATQSSQRAMDWLTGVALPELQAAAAHLARVI